MYQDLHTHTILSDGLTTYKQTLDICAGNNISVVAFTDHDLVPSKKELKILEGLKNHPVKWILGVEMSTNIAALHIVGLFVDPTNEKLIEQGEIIAQDRKERLVEMVKNLKKIGFQITAKECLAESFGEIIQRPHIVAALLKKDENIRIIKQLIKKFKKESEKNPVLKEKYLRMKKQMKAEKDNPYRQPVYVLFLGPNAFVPGVYVQKEGGLDYPKACDLIRQAGGIAILAHWSECKDKLPIEAVEKMFKDGRIDGAEIVYDFYRIGMGEERELRQEQEQIKKLVKKYKLLASGGSDAHSAEGLIRFARTPWAIKQTVGLVEKMLIKKKVFRGWSTV